MERGPSDDTQGETEEGDHRIKVDVNEMLKISVSETRIQTSNKLVQSNILGNFCLKMSDCRGSGTSLSNKQKSDRYSDPTSAFPF